MLMITNKKDLTNYLKADHNAFGFKYPLLAKFSWSENGTMFAYVRISDIWNIIPTKLKSRGIGCSGYGTSSSGDG